MNVGHGCFPPLPWGEDRGEGEQCWQVTHNADHNQAGHPSPQPPPRREREFCPWHWVCPTATEIFGSAPAMESVPWVAIMKRVKNGWAYSAFKNIGTGLLTVMFLCNVLQGFNQSMHQS